MSGLLLQRRTETCLHIFRHPNWRNLFTSNIVNSKKNELDWGPCPLPLATPMFVKLPEHHTVVMAEPFMRHCREAGAGKNTKGTKLLRAREARENSDTFWALEQKFGKSVESKDNHLTFSPSLPLQEFWSFSARIVDLREKLGAYSAPVPRLIRLWRSVSFTFWFSKVEILKLM